MFPIIYEYFFISYSLADFNIYVIHLQRGAAKGWRGKGKLVEGMEGKRLISGGDGGERV